MTQKNRYEFSPRFQNFRRAIFFYSTDDLSITLFRLIHWFSFFCIARIEFFKTVNNNFFIGGKGEKIKNTKKIEFSNFFTLNNYKVKYWKLAFFNFFFHLQTWTEPFFVFPTKSTFFLLCDNFFFLVYASPIMKNYHSECFSS